MPAWQSVKFLSLVLALVLSLANDKIFVRRCVCVCDHPSAAPLRHACNMHMHAQEACLGACIATACAQGCSDSAGSGCLLAAADSRSLLQCVALQCVQRLLALCLHAQHAGSIWAAEMEQQHGIAHASVAG
jgi:hypothetical protein